MSASVGVARSLEVAIRSAFDSFWSVLGRPVSPNRYITHLFMIPFLMTLLFFSAACGEEHLGSGGENPRSGEEILRLIQAEIHGEDKQGNGIRDDVELWVDSNFGSDRNHREALRQLAKDYQTALMTTGEGRLSLEASASITQSVRCMKHFFAEESELTLLQLKAVILNSDVRVRAWLKANQHLEDSGRQVDLSPSGGACRFEF